MAARGFTKASNRAMFDDSLSLQARAVYTMLLHVAWLHRPDKESGDVLGKPVPLPASPELAAELGVPEPSFRRYLNELRAAGYVETERPRRRCPLIYRIYARPQTPEERLEAAASPLAGDQTSPLAGDRTTRERDLRSEEETKTASPIGDASAEIPWEELGPPPPLVLDDDGRSAAYDALASETGIVRGSPRVAEVAVALHGNKRHLRTQPGINRQFWLETAEHYGMTLPEVRARAEANPLRYQQALAECVHGRAQQFRTAWPRLTLTPGGLAKWWLSLEDYAQSDPAGGLTAEQIRSMA